MQFRTISCGSTQNCLNLARNYFIGRLGLYKFGFPELSRASWSFLKLHVSFLELPRAIASQSFPELPRAFQKLPRSFRSFPETSGAELPGIFSELPGSLLELPGAAQELPGASLSNEVLYRKAGSTPVCTNLVRNYITGFTEYIWNMGTP